ncbi:MAG: L,D-transpeptidase [Nannocystaceae bacterium]|nr:L,D-transpeptidase [bacterium]
MNARRTLSLVLIALASCTHRSDPSGATPKYALVPTSREAPTNATPQPAEPAELQDEVVVIEDVQDEVALADGSYILRAPSVVRATPDRDGVALGVLAVGTRLPQHEPIDASGCRGGWVPVQPRGFACIGLEVSEDEPRALVQPVVRGGAKLPTVYGRVRRSAKVYADASAVSAGRGEPAGFSLTVERRGSVKVAGKEFWRTRHGLIARADIRRLRGSAFEGVALSEEVTLPVAWTIPGERRSVAVRSKPSLRARSKQRLPAFTVLAQPDTSQDADFVFAPEAGYLSREDVRVAMPTEVPADLVSDEMWLDVNLKEQTLVAYRGETPVFATLVSTGKARYETPVGEFRIERKVAMRTMNSRPGAKESYAVDKVPWTAYFKDSYALHTAYWHSGFGRVRSHGCINLSPADAKRLYGWMGPHAAPGWREVYATEDQPGTRVRIRKG